jgi:hypothetical protein
MEEIDELTYRDLPYPGYEGIYQMNGFSVKSLAREVVMFRMGKIVKKLVPEMIMKMNTRNGYPSIGLHKKGKLKRFFFHKMKADLYLAKPEGKKQVNHINGIKADFSLSNLEWCTAKENTRHAINTGLRVSKKGAECKLSKSVSQFTRNGVFIKSFGSSYEAMRLTGIKRTNISAVMRGKAESAGGFIWKFT